MTLPHKQRFSALGTEWQIETSDVLPQEVLWGLQQRIEVFDATYSRFRSDSLVAQLARQPGTMVFPEDVVPLLGLYKSLYDLTQGTMTPLVGDALEAAGYDAQYSLRPRAPVSTPSWDEALVWRDTELTAHIPVTLDFGAAGKGYLVDILGSLLEQAGIHDYVIDASGDIRHRGASANQVGLEHPQDPSMVIGAVDVRNRSLCASATNRRAWGDGMHHIFHPHIQAPVRGVVATWVLAETTLVADGLATALFFVSPDALAGEYEFEYVRLHHDGSLDYSTQFSGELFT